MSRRRLWLLRTGWVVAVATLALGGAGIVGSGDHLPGDGTRPELTWRADREIRPGLADLGAQARALDVDVEALGERARQALVDLLARRTDALQADLDAGTEAALAIRERAAAIEAATTALPHVDDPRRFGGAIQARLAAVQAIPGKVRSLPGQWAALVAGTVPAVRVTTLLEAHDQRAFDAVKAGKREDYAGALTILADAVAQLDAAARLRDQLAPTVDVSTLTLWIDRNRLHDTALADLWRALQASSGRVTEQVKQAIKQQQEAEQLLPPDTRALVVILGDLTTGSVNEAAINIERARGALAATIATLD